MKGWVTISSFFLLACRHDSTPTTILYSQHVKDSFDIYIATPPRMDAARSYDVVYYLDGNLRSGKKLREMIKRSEYAATVASTIFVGIGHRGHYRTLRRRDFTLPRISEGDTAGRTPNHGQVENFYRFLATELLPKINATYKTNTANNTVVGHSLSGLFVFYCLFKNDTLFRNYYALSPSLWIDHYGIYRFNHLTKEGMPRRYLYFSAGGLEVLNRIKGGANRMNRFLKAQAYRNLHYTYEVHPGETHHSQVEPSLHYLLRQK